MSEPLLRIHDLRVDFPGVVAVDDLSLTLEGGDVWALVGPNGAGKTTTMRAVAGLQIMTRGDVDICGLKMEGDALELKRKLGYMPDFSPLYDKLAVWEFLDHFAVGYRIPKRLPRIEQVLELTRLTDKRQALCKELSRGMKQRLILARTLLHDPEVLLLDEPASGLDPMGRKELRDTLLELAGRGKAVLVSSHILSELSTFCDKVAIMEKGKLKFAGPVERLAGEHPTRRWSLKWRSTGKDPRSLLEGDKRVASLELTSGSATFDFTESPDQLDELLKALVLADVRVSEWRSLSGDLEHVFFASGVKEVM